MLWGSETLITLKDMNSTLKINWKNPTRAMFSWVQSQLQKEEHIEGPRPQWCNTLGVGLKIRILHSRLIHKKVHLIHKPKAIWQTDGNKLNVMNGWPWSCSTKAKGSSLVSNEIRGLIIFKILPEVEPASGVWLCWSNKNYFIVEWKESRPTWRILPEDEPASGVWPFWSN